MRKLHTVEGLDEYVEKWNNIPLDRRNTVVISTEERSAEECAAEIAARVL